MILDKILFEKIEPVGLSIIKKTILKTYPNNIKEMVLFLNEIKKSIENEDFDGLLIGNVLFYFVSSLDVRNRKTTARTFEDIFCSLFGLTATDDESRTTPFIPDNIIKLDCFNSKDDDWKISTDLANNKREKTDVLIGKYKISLKTLKGILYDETGKVMPKTVEINGKKIKNEENDELNVGSLSYRALLKSILTDKEIALLGDRKGGLGSGSALRKNVFDKIKKYGKTGDFYDRLKIFLEYVYEDDVYIVLKSNYKITWYLIPASSFQKSICNAYKENESTFQNVFYRWENNNLRLQWKLVLAQMDKDKLPYDLIEMDLWKAVFSKKMKKFIHTLNKEIEEAIKEYMDYLL